MAASPGTADLRTPQRAGPARCGVHPRRCAGAGRARPTCSPHRQERRLPLARPRRRLPRGPRRGRRPRGACHIAPRRAEPGARSWSTRAPVFGDQLHCDREHRASVRDTRRLRLHGASDHLRPRRRAGRRLAERGWDAGSRMRVVHRVRLGFSGSAAAERGTVKEVAVPPTRGAHVQCGSTKRRGALRRGFTVRVAHAAARDTHRQAGLSATRLHAPWPYSRRASARFGAGGDAKRCCGRGGGGVRRP